MAITYVGEQGTLAINNGTTGTQAITLSSNCTAGNTVILLFVARNTNAAAPSITDSQGNTWTIDIGPFNTGNQWCIIASTRQDVGTLQSADTVTVVSATAFNNARIASLEEFSGLVTSDWEDQSANLGGSGSSFTSFPTDTTGTTDQADELAVVLWSINADGADAPSGDGAYTSFAISPNRQAGADTFKRWFIGQYKILSATGTQSATATKSVAESSYQSLLVTYRAVSADTGLAWIRA